MSKWASEGKDWVQDVTMHSPKKDEMNIAPLKMTRQPTKQLLRKKDAGVASKKLGNWILWFLKRQGQARGSRWRSGVPEVGQGLVYQDHRVEKEGDWAIHIFPEHNKEPMPGPNMELESWWRNGRTKWTLTPMMQQGFLGSGMAAVELFTCGQHFTPMLLAGILGVNSLDAEIWACAMMIESMKKWADTMCMLMNVSLCMFAWCIFRGTHCTRVYVVTARVCDALW